MLRYLLFIFINVNIFFPLGIKALAIPQSSDLLAKSGAGISNSIHINPALLMQQNAYVNFSKNEWFGGLEGQKISILLKNNTLISFETLTVEDIELRDEIANDTPIGFFGVYWYAWEVNRRLNIKNENFNIGYKVKLNFSKLYTETMHGYTIDIGFLKTMSDKLKLGFTVKNFGEESTGSLRAGTIPIFGLGSSYLTLNDKLLIISDIIYQDNNNLIKVAFETKLPYLNFILGSTVSDNYKDFSIGLKLDYQGWSFGYGNLSHDNPLLGNPTSITLTKYF